MRQYETIYILKPSLSEEAYEEVIGKFSAIIEKNQGLVIKTEPWGERTLAYELKKQMKGYYVLIEYCGDAALTEELERLFRLDDKVLKYQTVKLSDQVDPEALLKEVKAAAGEAEEEGTVQEDGEATDTTDSSTEEVENGVQ